MAFTLASHAKELILNTKLIYINHISPSYFFVIIIRLFVILCCQMSLATYQRQRVAMLPAEGSLVTLTNYFLWLPLVELHTTMVRTNNEL